MDRLLAVTDRIGQPLRPEDWELMQNATAQALKAIVNGLAGMAEPCTVMGLDITYESGFVHIADGWVFDGQELCFVPGAGFEVVGEVTDSQVGDYYIYLTPELTTSGRRTFKDTREADVYSSNRFVLGYAATVPNGSIQMASLPRLSGLVAGNVIAAMPIAPVGADIRYIRKSFSSSVLDQYAGVVSSPGAGKAIQVVSMSAGLSGGSQINADGQDLHVFYGGSAECGIGYFPAQFLNSAIGTVCGMLPPPGWCQVYQNQPVCIALSAETQPTGGPTNIVVHCLYKIITL